MGIIDTHFHLDLHKEESSVIHQIENDKVYTIAVTNAPSVFRHTKTICHELKYIRAALGYHPEVVASRPNEFDLFEEEIRSTRYIGEIGLDNSSRNSSSFVMQKKIFSRIIKCCDQERNKILTVHSRKADTEVLEIIGKTFHGKVILHYFTGTIKNLKIAIERGFYFSINYDMTQSKASRKLISLMPLEKILTESDYPFLDTGINHKVYLSKASYEIGKIKELSQKDVEKQVFENFKRLLKE